MEAVRRALGHLGIDSKPKAIHEYVKEAYGIDMDPNMISSYKSSIKRESAGRSSSRGPRRAAGRGRAAGISLEEIEAVKKLTDRMGAEKVRQLAQLLS
jgi:hypothetical protein